MTNFFSVILCTGKMPDEWREEYTGYVEGNRTVVRTSCVYSESFTVREGLYEGSALSPFLFVIVMNTLTQEII